MIVGKKFTWGVKVTSHSVDGNISMIKIFTMYFTKSRNYFFKNSCCIKSYINDKSKVNVPSGKIFPHVRWLPCPCIILQSPDGIFHIQTLPSTVPPSRMLAPVCHVNHCMEYMRRRYSLTKVTMS